MANGRKIKSMSNITAEEGRRSKRWDVWTHGGEAVGWWLYQSGYDSILDASTALADAIHAELNVVGGAITPSGITP